MKSWSQTRASLRFYTRSVRCERDLNEGFPLVLQEQSKRDASQQFYASESVQEETFSRPWIRQLDLAALKTKDISNWPRVPANAKSLPKRGEV